MKKHKKPKRVNVEESRNRYQKLILERRKHTNRMIDELIAGNKEAYEALKKATQDIQTEIDKLEKALGVAV